MKRDDVLKLAKMHCARRNSAEKAKNELKTNDTNGWSYTVKCFIEYSRLIIQVLGYTTLPHLGKN